MFGGQSGNTDPDEVPEPEPVVISRLGDVWTLGRHRIMCGDSGSRRDLDSLMDGKLADLCFTSPPYAQQRDYKSGEVDWNALMQDVFDKLPLRHEGQLLVNLGLIHRDSEWVPYWDGWIEWIRAQGWRRFGFYVWDQGFGLPGDWNGRFAPSHEFIFHFNKVTQRPRKTKDKDPVNIHIRGKPSRMREKDGSTKAFTNSVVSQQPTKIPDSVIRVTRHTGGLGNAGDHPAVFPIDLATQILTAYSDPDQIAFEPFCGSGSVLIAAEREQRVCYGMEIAPEYVDVALRRWQAFTGQPARLESTDRTFEEVGAARVAALAPAAA
jgi:DNA modification methylase